MISSAARPSSVIVATVFAANELEMYTPLELALKKVLRRTHYLETLFGERRGLRRRGARRSGGKIGREICLEGSGNARQPAQCTLYLGRSFHTFSGMILMDSDASAIVYTSFHFCALSAGSCALPTYVGEKLSGGQPPTRIVNSRRRRRRRIVCPLTRIHRPTTVWLRRVFGTSH